MAAPDIIRFKKATEHAQKAFAALGVLPDQKDRRQKLCDRVEQFLGRFIRLKAHDIHLFFASVEPTEALAFSKEGARPGEVFAFFFERQTATEFEDTLTIGVTLMFAAMKQAERRGFNPNTAGLFTLERMLEQAVEPVTDLHELLELGRPTPEP